MNFILDEKDIYILLKYYIKIKKEDKILYYFDFLNKDAFPKIYLKLAKFYQSINIKKMLHYLNIAIDINETKHESLIELCKYYLIREDINQYNFLCNKYKLDKQFKIELADKIIYLKLDKAINIYEEFADYDCVKKISNIYFYKKDFIQFIKYMLILSKDYKTTNDKDNVLLYLKYICLKTIDHEYKKMGFFKNILNDFIRKCVYCNKNSDTCIKIECKHYICHNCIYINMDKNDLMLQCKCNNKSMLITNKLNKLLISINNNL